MPRVSGLGTGEVKTANLADGAVTNQKIGAGVVENDRLKFFESSQIVPPVSAIVSAAHGFGQKPKRYQVVMQFIAAVNGYAIGDEVDMTSGAISTDGNNTGTTSCDATNIYLSVGAINYLVFDRNTTTAVGVATGNFRIVIRAWK